MKIGCIAVVLILSLICADTVLAQKEFTINGVMHHTDLEGGCWYLQTKDQRYELTGTTEDIAKCNVENRPVVLRVKYAGYMASTCMLGKRLEILEVLDTNFHARDPMLLRIVVKGRIHRTKSGCWYVQTNKFKYELEPPVPKQYMKVGAKYNRMSRVIPNESSCDGMNGKIHFGLDEFPPEPMKEKKYDPR